MNDLKSINELIERCRDHLNKAGMLVCDIPMEDEKRLSIIAILGGLDAVIDCGATDDLEHWDTIVSIAQKISLQMRTDRFINRVRSW